ncbi:MAG: SDR family oxidoreductase [Candidatus Lokiarchaeota archaeon]|nr:SDR family oxidoreductase [Candidatus Lokiarchaeota archaeon]
MNEKLILITGSTDGIGYQAAIELVRLGHHVIIHGRNQEKAKQTIQKIEKETKNGNLSYIYADLGSIAQIKTMVSEIYDRFERLDVLINNAGVIRPERTVNKDGLEETFAINYLAPFLLSNLLIELLKKGKSSRIVNVVSRVQSNQLDFNDLQLEREYTAVKAYAKSKTALILFTYFLAEKLQDKGITVNCLHPGVINTKLLRAAFGMGGASLTEGAKTLVFAATAPKLEDVSGKYFLNNRSSYSKEITYDRKVQKTLWKKTEEILDFQL